MSNENIFSALAKYASANEENYLTEAFVFLINSLLARDRPIGVEILNQLCVENNEFSFDTDEVISVSTQETIEKGILDIRISSLNKLIYIEVKDYSSVEAKQLRKYKKDLDSQSATLKKLILLTRFPVDFSEHQGIPDKHVHWFEVYDWLEHITLKDPISIYLIDSFKSFLEVKKMTIEKVSWEYINGVPALNNLLKMIRLAIEGEFLRISVGSGFARQYLGFYFNEGEFWCGIDFDEPQTVLFEIKHKEEFDIKAMKQASQYPTYESGSFFFELKLEDRHFFSLDKDKQLEEITKFVKECHTQSKEKRIKER